MTLGPVEVMVVRFPRSEFSGDIAPALQAVVDRGDIRVVDLAFVARGADGKITVRELGELSDDVFAAFDSAVGELLGLLNDTDLEQLGQMLAPGASAAAIVFEHTWARDLAAAVSNSNGEVIFVERVPKGVAEAAVAASAAEQSSATRPTRRRAAMVEGRPMVVRGGRPGLLPTAAPAAPVAPGQGVDLVGRLEKLASLRDSGVLSAQEFETAKAKLLGT